MLYPLDLFYTHQISLYSWLKPQQVTPNFSLFSTQTSATHSIFVYFAKAVHWPSYLYVHLLGLTLPLNCVLFPDFSTLTCVFCVIQAHMTLQLSYPIKYAFDKRARRAGVSPTNLFLRIFFLSLSLSNHHTFLMRLSCY
jgi:hypothetical protein